MNFCSKIDNRLIIILSVFICFYAVIFLLGNIAPAKFFVDDEHEGISLIRDDHEIGVYYTRIEYFRNSEIPYQKSRIEYPPLGLLYLTAPALFNQNLAGYELGLIAQNIILTVLLILVTYRLLGVLGRNKIWLSLLILPSFVYGVINRFDIWPVFLIQFSLLLLFKRRFNWAFILLSAAFLAKGYAIIFFPVFFVYWLNKTKRLDISIFKNKYLLIIVLPVFIITAIICLVAGFQNGLFPYIFQSTRYFAYGSIFTFYLSSLQPILPTWLFAGGAKVISMVLVLLQIVLPVLIYAGYKFFRRFINSKKDVVAWVLLVALLYILFSPYYSSQWFMWILPLAILLFSRSREVVILIIYDAINYLQFPVVWNYFGPQSLMLEVMVVIRTILFVIILIYVIKRIRRANFIDK